MSDGYVEYINTGYYPTQPQAVRWYRSGLDGTKTYTVTLWIPVAGYLCQFDHFVYTGAALPPAATVTPVATQTTANSTTPSPGSIIVTSLAATSASLPAAIPSAPPNGS